MDLNLHKLNLRSLHHILTDGRICDHANQLTQVSHISYNNRDAITTYTLLMMHMSPSMLMK